MSSPPSKQVLQKILPIAAVRLSIKLGHLPLARQAMRNQDKCLNTARRALARGVTPEATDPHSSNRLPGLNPNQ